MQCTNRVAKDRCGVADPRRRPYWRPSQEDLNPGNPEHFQAIMASREAMYRIINNADGVCNIDSDPGFCPGSPLSDYVKVLQGCRSLLDKHNVHGKQAKLVNWMLWGWGRKDHFDAQGLQEHQFLTLRSLKQGLREPFWLLCWQAEWLPMCRDAGVIERTLLFPYGVIEAEPSYPATNVDVGKLRELFELRVAKTPEIDGVMGNVQSPLLQFPHVYYFTAAMCDAKYRNRSEKDVLLDLSGHLYPEHRQLLADCFLALKAPDHAYVQSLADDLDGLVQQDKLGRLGIFGRKLFPDHRIVAQALVLQMKFRAARERLAQVLTAPTPAAECRRLLQDYFDAYLDWDMAHGWHGLWGWDAWPMGLPAKAAERLADSLGDRPAVNACFEELSQSLAARHDKKAVDVGCLAPAKVAVLALARVVSLAQKATATASVSADPTRYAPSAANDGRIATLYWPGALVQDNTEWLQLAWDQPQTFDKVVVRFLGHPSMCGRTIHLQRETEPGKWEDFAATRIAMDAAAQRAVATFQLPSPVTFGKIRIVNLLDVFEVEVY
ncbi:MAG: hypothetical protein HUU20_28695 [Pirellulales bacterium]|nr:hypothetical protein [Pirellulales bacterium]